jgi:hypothetical protein
VPDNGNGKAKGTGIAAETEPGTAEMEKPPPETEDAAREAVTAKGRSGGRVETRPTGAIPPEEAKTNGVAGKGVAGRKKGCPAPLTTEANVGAAPAAIKAANGGADAEKKGEAEGRAAMGAA